MLDSSDTSEDAAGSDLQMGRWNSLRRNTLKTSEKEKGVVEIHRNYKIAVSIAAMNCYGDTLALCSGTVSCRTSELD